MALCLLNGPICWSVSTCCLLQDFSLSDFLFFISCLTHMQEHKNNRSLMDPFTGNDHLFWDPRIFEKVNINQHNQFSRPVYAHSVISFSEHSNCCTRYAQCLCNASDCFPSFPRLKMSCFSPTHSSLIFMMCCGSQVKVIVYSHSHCFNIQTHRWDLGNKEHLSLTFSNITHLKFG